MVLRADPDLAPFTALLTALTEVGDLVADEHAAECRAIVQASRSRWTMVVTSSRPKPTAVRMAKLPGAGAATFRKLTDASVDLLLSVRVPMRSSSP